MGTNLRVRRVHALEHTAPLVDNETGEARRRPGWSWSYLVHVHFESEGHVWVAVGESTAQARLEPAEQKQAWRSLSKACQQLTGMEFDDADAATDALTQLVAPGTDETVAEAIAQALKGSAEVPKAQLWARYKEVMPYTRRHMWSPGPKQLLDPAGRTSNTYDIDVYRGLSKVGEANQELEKAALAFGLDTFRTSWKDFTASSSAGRISFGLSYSDASSPVSGAVTSNKQLTRGFLKRAGVPVPSGQAFRFSQVEEAITYAAELGYPVVVKPLAGKSGRGVVSGIENDKTARWAIEQVREIEGEKTRFIVEQHVDGHDYRVYVAYGEVLSVVLRTPASVVGDGVRTLAELVLAKNHHRQLNPHTRTRLIALDDAAEYYLLHQGANWDTVPEAGQIVTLAAAANISRGGDSSEVLHEVHPSILDAALRAVDAVPGLNQAGVDFLIPDHTVAIDQQNCGICEINTTPALMANQAPVFGEAQPIAQELVRHAATEAGITVSERQEALSVVVRADGVSRPRDLHDWLVGQAQRLGLGGRVRSVGKTNLVARLVGPTEYVAAVIAAFHAVPTALRPDSVRATHFTGQYASTFKEAAK